MAPHTPHDDVYDIVVSPDFVHDGTVFALCRDMFLRSTDRGRTWTHIVRGLNTMWQYFTDKEQRFSLDMSVSDKSVMYFASRGDGVYRSTDAGWSWTRLSVPGHDARISLLAISPHDPERVLAAVANGGLLATTDGGASWTPIDVTGAPVSAIAYAADRPGLVMLGDTEGGLHTSTDGGATWTRSELPDVGAIRAVAFSPAFGADGTIFVGTERSGVFKSVDGGGWFASKNAGLADTSISSVTFSPAYAADARVWVSTWTGGVFASRDGGETWRASSTGLTRNTQKYEARYVARPHFGRIIAAPGADSASRTLFLAAFDGFFRSVDSGETWVELETLPSTLPISVAVSPNFAQDGSIAATSYINGAYFSEDRGDTWIPINDGLEEPAFMQQAPDRIARLFEIAFSPNYAADQRLLCSNWTAFLQSDTRGQTWIRRDLTDEKLPLQQFVMVISPQYTDDGTILLGNRFGQIWKSVDGGATFTVASKLGGHIRSLAISPQYATDGTIFAACATRPEDVHVSTDGAASWSPCGEVGASHLAISPSFPDDRTLVAATRSGVLVTRDACATWNRVEGTPFGAHAKIEAVAISPSFATDGTVLVAVPGKGLFTSVDGARTFTATGADLLERNVVFANIPNAVASPIVFSPNYATDRTVFGYSPSGFFRSTDGGEHWTEITPPRTTHPMPVRIIPTPKADRSEAVQVDSWPVVEPEPVEPPAWQRMLLDVKRRVRLRSRVRSLRDRVRSH
jgi:photosystem II stability/assembly factor-like uncharacterized protein